MPPPQNASAHDLDVELTGLRRAPEPDPHRQIHLGAARRRQIAEVEHAIRAARACPTFALLVTRERDAARGGSR